MKRFPNCFWSEVWLEGIGQRWGEVRTTVDVGSEGGSGRKRIERRWEMDMVVVYRCVVRGSTVWERDKMCIDGGEGRS